MKNRAIKLIAHHAILIVLTLVLMIFFGGWLVGGNIKYGGYFFSGFTAFLYFSLIFSECFSFARKDFLDSKGDITDKFLGVKLGLFSQLPGFFIFVFIFIIHIVFSQNIYENSLLLYVNTGFRIWMSMFMGFFSEGKTIPYLTYAITIVLPVMVTGAAYYFGVKKSVKRIK